MKRCLHDLLASPAGLFLALPTAERIKTDLMHILQDRRIWPKGKTTERDIALYNDLVELSRILKELPRTK